MPLGDLPGLPTAAEQEMLLKNNELLKTKSELLVDINKKAKEQVAILAQDSAVLTDVLLMLKEGKKTYIEILELIQKKAELNVKEAADLKAISDAHISINDLLEIGNGKAKEKLLSLAKEEEARKNIEKIVKSGITDAEEVLKIHEKEVERTQLFKDILGGISPITSGLGDHFGKIGTDVATAALVTGNWGKVLADIAQSAFTMYEHTAAINRTTYDTNASLGNLGSKSMTFKDTIISTAEAFNDSADNVAKVVNQLTSAGISADGVNKTIGEMYARTTLYSEFTLGEQIKLASTYTKEFGMNEDAVRKQLALTFDVAVNLRKEVTNLDIHQFTSQVNDAALGMRKLGLEASDALALATGFAAIGMAQERAVELTKGFGTAMEKPEQLSYSIGAFQTKLTNQVKEQVDTEEHLLKVQAEKKAIGENLSAAEEKKLKAAQDFLNVNKDHVALYKELINIKDPLERMGWFARQKPGVAAEVAISGAGAAAKEVGINKIDTIQDIDKFVGAAMMKVPILGEMLTNMGGAEAFTKSVSSLRGPTTKEEKIAEENLPEEERKKLTTMRERANATGENLGTFEGAMNAAIKLGMKDLEKSTKDAAETAKKQHDAAVNTATNTKTLSESVKNIENILLYKLVGGKDNWERLNANLEAAKKEVEKDPLSILKAVDLTRQETKAGQHGEILKIVDAITFGASTYAGAGIGATVGRVAEQFDINQNNKTIDALHKLHVAIGEHAEATITTLKSHATTMRNIGDKTSAQPR